MMSDAVIISMIGGVVSIVTVVLTLLIKKSQTALEVSQANLHKQINSRMDELLYLTKQKGAQEEKDKQEGNTSVSVTPVEPKQSTDIKK